MKAKVVFVDTRIKKAYERLKAKNPLLFKWLNRAFDDLAENPYCGVFIPSGRSPRYTS